MYSIISETDYNGVIVIQMDIDGQTLSVEVPENSGQAEIDQACIKRANEYLTSIGQ